MISKSKNFIFIHISKCAGTSITEMLCNYASKINDNNTLWIESYDHSTYVEYENYLRHEIKNYFVFSFVRNPFDRLLSLYSTFKRDANNNPVLNESIDGLDIATAACELSNFNDWIIFIGNNKIKNRHLNNQINWLVNRNGQIPNNLFIGKFENLDCYFKKVCHKINIPFIKMQHLNKSKHLNYKDVYNSKSIEIVSKRFKNDLLYFNYSF